MVQFSKQGSPANSCRSGIPVVLTVVGWAQILKAFIYFIFPAYGLRKLQIPSHERAQMFIYPGVAFLVLAGLLGYHLAAGDATP